MLCERCHEQEATIFSTFCHCSSDPDQESTTTTRNLCAECHEIENPGAAARMAAQLEAGCRFCAKKVGATICEPCAPEMLRYLQEKGITYSAKRNTTEELAQRMQVLQKMEAHMKRWVSEGGPDRAG